MAVNLEAELKKAQDMNRKLLAVIIGLRQAGRDLLKYTPKLDTATNVHIVEKMQEAIRASELYLDVPQEEHAGALDMLSDAINVLAKTRQFMQEYARDYPVHKSREWWDEVDKLTEDINVYRRSEWGP